MRFGEKLAALRAAADLTQEQLADASGIPAWTLRKYEQGVISKVSLPAAVALARALGTDCLAFADCDDVVGPPAALPASRSKSKGKKGG